jgi:hypothetical protein
VPIKTSAQSKGSWLKRRILGGCKGIQRTEESSFSQLKFAEQNVTPAVDRRELNQRFGREGPEDEEEDLIGEVLEATGREAGGGGGSGGHEKEDVLSHANRAQWQLFIRASGRWQMAHVVGVLNDEA